MNNERDGRSTLWVLEALFWELMYHDTEPFTEREHTHPVNNHAYPIGYNNRREQWDAEALQDVRE